VVSLESSSGNSLTSKGAVNPFEGIGKLEPLKASLQGYWSRRIDSEHRLAYAVENREIVYISFRFHYER